MSSKITEIDGAFFKKLQEKKDAQDAAEFLNRPSMRDAHKKSLDYYAITYGGVPMTAQGAYRFLVASAAAGYTVDESLEFVPDEFLSLRGIKEKRKFLLERAEKTHIKAQKTIARIGKRYKELRERALLSCA